MTAAWARHMHIAPPCDFALDLTLMTYPRASEVSQNAAEGGKMAR